MDECEETLKQQRAEQAALSTSMEEIEKRRLGVQSELSQKTQTLADTNINISKAEDKLKSLINNVNVFSEEFLGFVQLG